MRRAVVIIGKAPRPGRVKTRLMPPLSADAAAALSAAFLLDTVATCLQLGWERTALIHPHGDGPTLRPLLPGGVELLEQPGAGLGDALAHAFVHHFGRGFGSVVLVGSDNPSLPATPILAAATALNAARDIAIGPSADGGYYLIGMRAPHVGVFEQIEWSTPSVYRQTLERAAALGLDVHPVDEWYDVDEPADLDRLRRELAASAPGVAPHTWAALGGTSTRGVSPDRAAYVAATASPTARP